MVGEPFLGGEGSGQEAFVFAEAREENVDAAALIDDKPHSRVQELGLGNR